MTTETTTAVKCTCTACHEPVEPELLSVYPASEVCFDCMPRSEKARLEKELNQVQLLDRSLLAELPVVAGWEVGLHYRPSRLLSGDFYDVCPERDVLTIVVGDVMGKGIPAALLRSGLQSSLKALSPENDSSADVLRKANEHFLTSASPGRLASVFLGTLDAVKGELRYANAGHLPPLLRRASGEWLALEATGMVLGALENVTYEECHVTLEKGDVLAIFSDGFTEAENGEGKVFDEREIVRSIDALPEASAQALASAVADALGRFAPGDPSDDRTLLVVKRS